MAGGDCARWQDNCLDVQRTKGCPPTGPCPPAISGASGESSLSGLKLPVHAPQPNWSASTHSLADGASPHTTDSASVGSVDVASRTSESPEATAADDCQFLYDLFPEVVAEESKQACGNKPLHLKLDHAEVLRALDRQNTAVLRPGSHVTSDMKFNFPTAKAALEVTCGLPTYDMDGAAASAPRPRRMCPSVMPSMAPVAAAMPMVAPASSLSCAVAPGKRSISPQASAGELLSCHASPTGTATLQHSRPASSMSSAAFSSSYLQANMVPASSGQLTPAVPSNPAALSHSGSLGGGCLQLPGDGGNMLDGDLGDLVTSFQKDGGQDGLGPLFLSDSDDASDGTQLSLGRMWGGADVFDGIFDDVDAMDSESYGSHFDSHIPDCGMDSSPLASDLTARGHSTVPAFIKCEALSDSSSNSVFASSPLMGTAAGCGASGLGLLPVASCGDLIHHGLGEGPGGFGVSRALSITHGGAMPAIPRCASTLLLQHIPTPVAAALPELPASLVQIPAKTNECAKSARQACFAKCKEKRHNRQSGKIRYEMRKINADKRPRIKGRFVKREELAVLAAAEQALAGRTAVSGAASLAFCVSHPATTENAPVWA